MFLSIVLQGALGSPTSDLQPTMAAQREFECEVGALETQVNGLLAPVQDCPRWPELSVIMAFVWLCGPGICAERAVYRKKEQLLDLSICIGPEELSGLSNKARAALVLRKCAEHALKALSKNGHNAQEIAKAFETVISTMAPDPLG